ncbi:hypothetical protein DFQ28_003715 [Apophysomyces sp. BC1034]|nr:hypothetical protein DFQ30_003720 [Apophysomyces sp. BC1015]KAG0178899.1 hypothetical protein DFQ29_002854 [Apophysomyces sp. BC1021]KAG0189222.1 hypothetical protein DFQ28_003715 [Apophysomyces sp. BC1034]
MDKLDAISPQPSRMDSQEKVEPQAKHERSIQTAHVTPVFSKGDSLGPHALIPYDHFVSYATTFIGPLPLETIVSFVDNVILVIQTTRGIDVAEIKRRIEQVLPPYDAKAYKWRGMQITTEEACILRSLASKVLVADDENNSKYLRKSHLTIVDDEQDDLETPIEDVRSAGGGEVEYLRPIPSGHFREEPASEIELPARLPSFVQLSEGDPSEVAVEYDGDFTPCDSDSEGDENPIQIG